MTESKHKGIKDAMADQFGGGKEDGDAWLDGEVTTEGMEEEEGGMMHEEDMDQTDEGKDDELDETSLRSMIRGALSEDKKEMDKEKAKKKKAAEKAKTEARKKKKDDEELDEASLRRIVRDAISEAKKKKAKKKKDDEDEDEDLDESSIRESIRQELTSIFKSRGVTLGGTGWGFKK